MTLVRRKLDLTVDPTVERSLYSQEVTITAGTFRGKTKYVCKLKLDTYSTVYLIKQLRKALRDIRDHGVTELNSAVEQAEGPL